MFKPLCSTNQRKAMHNARLDDLAGTKWKYPREDTLLNAGKWNTLDIVNISSFLLSNLILYIQKYIKQGGMVSRV